VWLTGPPPLLSGVVRPIASGSIEDLRPGKALCFLGESEVGRGVVGNSRLIVVTEDL